MLGQGMRADSMFRLPRATRDQRGLVLLLVLLALTGCASRRCIEGDLTQGHPELADLTRVFLASSWVKHAQVCQVGRYVVMVPANSPEPTIVLSRDGHPVVWVQRGFGVSLFQRVGHSVALEHILNLQDFNEDGVYDRLSYMTYDASGRPFTEFIDLNLDGEPDLKVLQAEKSWFARIDGRWMPLENGKVLMDDGNWKLVNWDGQRWVVQP